VLIAGVALLFVAAGMMWLLTGSLSVPLVLALTALMGLPFGVVSISSSQGMFLSTRPQERGVAAGIYQTSRYLGAIVSTVIIGIVYGSGVNQANWGLMVLVMLGLGAAAFVVTLLWRERAE
jgi:predicted MFS family arabinose efflux permease